MHGWISLHRKILEHWIWQSDKYLKAWIWMLLRANHENSKILFGANLINVKRGEFITSLNNIHINTGLSMRATRTFLTLLEKDKMIVKKSTSKTTKITILNYDSYQPSRQTNDKQTTSKRQANDKQATTDNNVYNNDNNDNNDKERNLIAKYFGEEFLDKWDEWIEYRGERRLPKYKDKGLKAALTRLYNLSNGCPETAGKIIDQSIGNNWQGLFELKKNGKKFTEKANEFINDR